MMHPFWADPILWYFQVQHRDDVFRSSTFSVIEILCLNETGLNDAFLGSLLACLP